MSRMRVDPIVLNFKDTLLHQSDLDILNGYHWLTDNIISFYFEYLQKLEYSDARELLFVGPEVVQCLKVAKNSDLENFLEPLSAKQKQFIFLALNNCEALDKPGGSHWSLLVYSQPEQTFFHFDSLRGTNYVQAGKLTGKLLNYLSPSGTGDFIEYESLQQVNSYDCGIFVLCNADLLVKYCLSHEKVAGCGKVSEQCVSEKRLNIIKTIKTLQSQGY